MIEGLVILTVLVVVFAITLLLVLVFADAEYTRMQAELDYLESRLALAEARHYARSTPTEGASP